MSNKEMVENFNIEENTNRLEVRRGGGVDISLDELGFKDARMAAHQNYAGGGLLCAVSSSCNIQNWRDYDILVLMSERLKEYYHNLTNPTDDEWSESSYEQNQKRPTSNY
jgi:hypothetical protein